MLNTPRHPLTGAPLAPIYVDRHGRCHYPIMGGSEPAPETPPPVAPPTPPTPEQGWPENTPLAEMTLEQREAYWRDKAQKHEQSWKRVVDKNLTPDQILAMQAKLDQTERDRLPAAEKAIADAREAAKAEARAEMGSKGVDIHVNALVSFGRLTADNAKIILEGINRAAYVDAEGNLDHDKLAKYLDLVAPATGANGHKNGTGSASRDPHQGTRPPGARPTGVAAGAELHAARKKQPATS